MSNIEDEKLAEALAKRKAERPSKPKKKNKGGRPSKKKILSKTRGHRGVMGRPKGDAAIMNEYKARMLASPKSAKVLETILNAALDDEHKNQSAAWKIVVDRMLPVGMFEKEVIKDGGRNSIQINITGLTGHTIENEEIEDAEVIDTEGEV